jgi:hypothetical protein
MQAFITLNYGDADDSRDEDTVANPFISAEFLTERLDVIGDKKGHDLSLIKAILRALRFLPDIDAARLLEKHADPIILCSTRILYCTKRSVKARNLSS